MMRAAIVLFIAGVAGVIGWIAWFGECRGGVVVRAEADCRERLTGDLCRAVFARAPEVARNAATVYMDPVECSRIHGPCLEHAVRTGGWTPRPHGFCVTAEQGRIAGMVPVYRSDGGRSQQ